MTPNKPTQEEKWCVCPVPQIAGSYTCISCGKPIRPTTSQEDAENYETLHLGETIGKKYNKITLNSVTFFPEQEDRTAYSAEITMVRPIIAKYQNEWSNSMLCELAELLATARVQGRAEVREDKDAAYRERNHLVEYLATRYPSHLKLHPASDTSWEDDWRTIVCIHSPEGQMTWHIHDSQAQQFNFLNRKPDPCEPCEWDGHTTEEKYYRLACLAHPISEHLLEEDKKDV